MSIPYVTRSNNDSWLNYEFSSDDDSDFDPDDISGSDTASEMSDRDRAEAEAIDEEYYDTTSTTFSSRIQGQLKKNGLAIAALTFHALTVVQYFAKQNVTALFNKIYNNQ